MHCFSATSFVAIRGRICSCHVITHGELTDALGDCSSRKAKAAVADLIARQAAVDRELGSIQLSLKAFCTDE